MAAPATYLEEECFNVYWKIKNFSYCCQSISSPKFNISGNWYSLELDSRFVNVVCEFKYNHGCGYCLNIEMSFLTYDESPEESVSGKRDVKLQMPKDVIFESRRNAFLLDDTLTVRFRCLTESGRGKLCICSQIGVMSKCFLWTLKYGDRSGYGWNYGICAYLIPLYGDIKFKLKSMDGINSDEQFSVEICRTRGERCFFVLKISLLDVEGNALNEVSDEFMFEKQEDVTKTRGFPSIIKKSKWIEYKNILLSEDKLSLKCVLTATAGGVSDETAVICYCENALPLQKEYAELLERFKEKSFHSSIELQTDLKSILEDGTLRDVNLQIGSKVIPAHKSILGARSPVFRAMFTKDMKEAINNTVIIEDFEEETIRGLLLYLYTDTTYCEQWENIKNLYLASDKYQVLSLKEKCSSYLESNLSVCNVCEALVLSDLHQDTNLKTAAICFISEFDSAVFASDAWKKLEINNSSLAFQVLRDICCNKRFK